MNYNQVIAVLHQLEFNHFGVNFQFFLQEKGDGFLLQVGAELPCNVTSVVQLQKGGKYYLSSHAIKTEVVFKALKACLDFVEHEAREGFTYRGVPIAFPHLHIDELKDFVNQAQIALRED